MADERKTNDEQVGVGGHGMDVSSEVELGDEGLSELELENKRLREENQRLKEYRASLPPKERMYDHIPLTVKQMDIIIGGLLVLLVVVVVLGLLNR